MTKLFLNQLHFINSLIKRNSKKVQDLSFISTQQPSELLYKGGSRNHSCPAPKEFQLQKKLSVGPPSRGGLNYTKKALLFSLHWRAVVRDQCEQLSIEVTGIVPLLEPQEKFGADAQSTAQSQTQAAAPAPGTGSSETSWLLPALPPTPAPPHPSSPSPQSLLQTELQGSPQPHTPTSHRCSVSCLFSLLLLHTELNWLILKQFFFTCTPSH